MARDGVMDETELAALLADPATSIRIVVTFTHGKVAQLFRSGKRVSPPIIPNRKEGQSLGDVLKMLGDLAEEET